MTISDYYRGKVGVVHYTTFNQQLPFILRSAKILSYYGNNPIIIKCIVGVAYCLLSLIALKQLVIAIVNILLYNGLYLFIPLAN